MSSHHVVREKQEPALLIMGLNTFADELLGQLMEWSPTVIVTADTAEQMHSLGIKMDWLITNDFSHVLQSDVKIMPAGNDTFLAAALKYLVAHGYPTVNIVTDVLELNELLVFAAKIGLVIYHNNQKIYPVSTGFSKWKPAGEVIELLSQSLELYTNGLTALNNNCWQTTTDGFFTLRFKQPYLFIAEDIF